MLRESRFEAIRTQRLNHSHELHQRLDRVAGFRDHDEARAREIEPCNRPCEGRRIEVVEEPRPWPPLLLDAGTAGNVPTGKLGERLPAEARAARAEKHDGCRALRQPRQRRFCRDDVGVPVEDGEMLEARRSHASP